MVLRICRELSDAHSGGSPLWKSCGRKRAEAFSRLHSGFVESSVLFALNPLIQLHLRSRPTVASETLHPAIRRRGVFHRPWAKFVTDNWIAVVGTWPMVPLGYYVRTKRVGYRATTVAVARGGKAWWMRSDPWQRSTPPKPT
jgi:hypothetical protein